MVRKAQVKVMRSMFDGVLRAALMRLRFPYLCLFRYKHFIKT